MHFSVAAGGGFVGVSGAIDVSVIGSDTLAWIGNASVNQAGGNAGAALAQGVYVSAANKADITAFAGAISGGFVGAAGAVNVGVLKNNVNAQIRNGAVVTSRGDTQVNALGIKHIDSFTFSGAGGFVGGAGAVSVWSVGDSLSDGYSGSSDGENQDQSANALQSDKDGGGTDSADHDAASQGEGASSMVGGQIGGLGSSGSSSSQKSDQRLGGIASNGAAALSASAPKARDVAAKEAAAQPAIHGTGATIEAGTTVTTGGNLQVKANENLHNFPVRPSGPPPSPPRPSGPPPPGRNSEDLDVPTFIRKKAD